jgi:hypothetical protein
MDYGNKTADLIRWAFSIFLVGVIVVIVVVVGVWYIWHSIGQANKVRQEQRVEIQKALLMAAQTSIMPPLR